MPKKNLSAGIDVKSPTYTIKDKDGDVTKRWYVLEIKADGEFVKHYGGVNRIKDFVGRQAAIAALYKSLLAANLPAIRQIDRAEMPLRATLDNHATNLRRKTYHTFSSKVGIAEEWLQKHGFRKFDELRAEQFIKYMQTVRKVHPTTIAAYFNTFRLLYNLRAEDNPFDKLHKPKATHTPAMFFTPQQSKEVTAAIRAQNPNLYTFVHFMYYTFVRPGELAQLRVGDVQLEHRRITIRSEVSKNKKTEQVIIPDELVPFIEKMNLHQYHPLNFLFSAYGHPYTHATKDDYFSRHHRNVMRSINYDTTRYKLYSWKHTGGVAFIRAGGNIKALQRQMRHSTLEQTDSYLRSLGLTDFETDLFNFPKLGG